MRRRRWLWAALALVAVVLVPVQAVSAKSAANGDWRTGLPGIQKMLSKTVTPEQREAAAARKKAQMLTTQGNIKPSALATPGPGGIPDLFGTTPNWAWTPEIRKFVDTLPGLGADKANNLGQYIPVAVPDTKTYPGCDYYEIELRQYGEKLHSDLATTTLRGYVQVNKGTDAQGNNTVDPAPIHYLGPIIQATKDRPVRVKFVNKLPVNAGGKLFLPVDTTVMGAGMGPLGMSAMPMNYSENRGTLHLHGGKTVWISDGTPHQWTTPAGENTPYPKGVSVRNVPDMPDPGPGAMTFYYSNQQSARFLFYHDHTYGITRLNVYAGEAAGYTITDDTEKKLIADNVIPTDQIPLIIQDKTFVDPSTIATTDPTWNWGMTPGTPHAGDLWFPHVYMPNQNPYDVTGANAMGRWDYAAWFWPPVTNLQKPPIPNPYYDPINAPWEPPMMPDFPNPSGVMEAFNDTPIVNGTAYPSLTVDPKAYRFRILNAADDRFWNLQLYQADTSTVVPGTGYTEVKMATATPTPGWPASWPTDGRDGGVPDPSTAGPSMIQIGTESGFLPKPAIVAPQPVDWNRNMKDFTFGNVSSHSMLLAPAERADVVIDFSKYAGKTLILYNDAPAAFPAYDPRLDYFTDAPDQTDTGGHAPTRAGYGPNTRTIMQIKVTTATAAPEYDLPKLEAAFASTASTPGVFAASQNPVIMPSSRYDSAYATSFPADAYVRINDTISKTFKTVGGLTLTLPLQPKGLHDEMGAAFDPIYGRMSGKMGVELPGTNNVNQNFVLYTFQDPATEILKDSMVPMSPVQDDGTQIWKITHNGVDTHAMHFHLFDVQLINRVGWDGAIRQPDDNELGWKDTVRVNPLEDTIVAMRPVAPTAKFGVPDSIRPLDPTMPLGSTEGFANLDPLTGQAPATPVTNQVVNFGWEYMWHCHLLSHEEMDMMRPISFLVRTTVPTSPVLTGTKDATGVSLTWTDPTPVDAPSTLGNPANEYAFRVERATVGANGVVSQYSTITTALANATSYRDGTATGTAVYSYRVVAITASGEAPSLPLVTSRIAVRVFGADRYTTAIAAAQDAFPNWANVTDIVLASGSDPQVDALPAAGLGKAYNAPVLLCPPTSLPGSVANAIASAGATTKVKLHIVGGQIDSATRAQLLAIPGVETTLDVIAGTDRYDTSQRVAKRMKDVMGPRQAVFFVNGELSTTFYDAANASAIAAGKGFPTLLVRTSSVPANTLSTVTYVGATEKYIIGGIPSVSEAVRSSLGVTAANRWSGADRYSTAVTVANNAAAKGWLSKTVIGIAQSVPDAISGGAGTGAKGGVLLLTAQTSLPTATQTFLSTNKAGIVDCKVYGSSASISDAVLSAINTAIR